MENQNIIKELKTAKLAYELALEWGYCPSNGDSAYVDGIDEYSGSRPDEIAHDILRLIDKL